MCDKKFFILCITTVLTVFASVLGCISLYEFWVNRSGYEGYLIACAGFTIYTIIGWILFIKSEME